MTELTYFPQLCKCGEEMEEEERGFHSDMDGIYLNFKCGSCDWKLQKLYELEHLDPTHHDWVSAE